MKFVLAAFLAAQVASVATTFNECFDYPEVQHDDSCRSLWYKLCDRFMINPGATCNFVTYSDAQMQWYSDSIQVYVWNYIMKFPDSNDSGSPDSNQWSLRQTPERECLPESLGNEKYYSESRLQARNGNCGFKFQIVNESDRGSYDFTFLRNSASLMAAGAAVAVSSLALF